MGEKGFWWWVAVAVMAFLIGVIITSRELKYLIIENSQISILIIFIILLSMVGCFFRKKIMKYLRKVKQIYWPINPWKRIYKLEILQGDIKARLYLKDLEHKKDTPENCPICGEPLYFKLYFLKDTQKRYAMAQHLYLKCEYRLGFHTKPF